MSRRILKKYCGGVVPHNKSSNPSPYPHPGPKSTQSFKSSSQKPSVVNEYKNLATVVLPQKVKELKEFIGNLKEKNNFMDKTIEEIGSKNNEINLSDKASKIINHFILNVNDDRDSVEFKKNHLIFKLTLLKLLGDINNENKKIKNNIRTELVIVIAQQLDELAITGNYIRTSLIGKTESQFYIVSRNDSKGKILEVINIEYYFDVATFLLDYLIKNNKSINFTNKEVDFYYYNETEKKNLESQGVNVSNVVNFISNTAIGNLANNILMSREYFKE